ncbi:hypothetical protein FV228_04750 [Methylobacterium sp. WL18]|nr:hypothetical protein FV228_04750 [Methylobacterium sp. WL18]
MNTHTDSYFATFGNTALPTSIAFSETSADFGGPRYYAHGRAAQANALDEGLMADEVSRILGGRSIVEAFPVWQGESPAEYAARAVAEMFVAYLQ